MSKKFRIATLGCRTNQYESQGFHDQLTTAGYTPATGEEVADLCIVNTCTVTESADSSSRHTIRQLIRNNPGAKVAVTGCYAERHKQAVEEIDGVTTVISNPDKEQLLNILYPEEEFPEFSIRRFDAHTRAFVKVQDGCNSFCTYCIIPYVRGRSRSRTIIDIVAEVERLVANGFKEIVLTGINIGDFEDGDARLCDLVKIIDCIDGVERLRISSIDPDEVDEELLAAVVEGKKTCQSMHIVLQSGSNVTLKRMNRKYTRQMFYDTVERLRSASSDFTFTTDIIVGFPGETEDDFQETLEVMQEVEFAKVHMFPYSPRPRTRAALYPNQVPSTVMKERKQKLLRVAEKQAFSLRERYVGKEMVVLTEKRDNESVITGHTDNFLEVRIDDPSLYPNQLIKVAIENNSPSYLLGRILNK